MTHGVLTAFLTAAGCAVALGVFAQQPPPASPSPTISVTGCVQQADADGSVAGTPLGTSVPPEQAGPTANRNQPWQGYLLADARPAAEGAAAPSAADAAAPPRATGTTGAAGSPLPVTYALDGDTAQLAGYKGQRVEVTGSVVEPAPSQAGSSGSNSTFKTGVKRLKVAAIKSVAPKC